MTLKKNWTTDDRGLLCCDGINDTFAEDEHARHLDGDCREDCPHCELDRELEKDKRHREHDNRLFDFVAGFARTQHALYRKGLL